MVLTATLLCASLRGMPVVSAIIWAMRGMQAVEPSTPGNSSGLRKGSASASPEELEAGPSPPELLALSGPAQPLKRAAAVPRPSAARKLRRESFVLRMAFLLLCYQ